MTSIISDKEAKTIPLSEPEISGNEWEYVKECLDSGWVSSVGDYVERFEKVVADYVGVKYAVAVVNGTSALHLSLLASGIKDNDEVIIPTLTFVAPANVIKYCGAHPVFMDSEEDTLCVDVSKVVEFLSNECESVNGDTYNKKTKRRVKAIIPVHIFGHPADMDVLVEISEKYNLDIVEDATESLGTEYKSRKTGTFGIVGCFSYNGNKIITTGGGGMVVTNDKGLAGKIRYLSTQAKDGSFEYEHSEIGYNYRLTNIQAALGVAQMERLEGFIAKKRESAALFENYFAEIDEVDFVFEKGYAKSNYWMNTIKVRKRDKNALMKYLLSKNIQVRPIWKLIHTLPMYKDCRAYSIEKAINAYDTCINIPCNIKLDQPQIKYITTMIKEYYS